MASFAIIVAVVVVLSLVAVYYATRAPTREKGKTLYERLGGIYAIAAVVNDFSDALIVNPVVGRDSPNPFLRDWNRNELGRLPGLKFMRTLWVASLAGGPYKFAGTKPEKCPFSLENAHARFQISPAEFDAVAGELGASLDKFKVGEREKHEVLAAFGAHKPDVTRGFDLARGITPGPIKC
jgi:hemoglobin